MELATESSGSTSSTPKSKSALRPRTRPCRCFASRKTRPSILGRSHGRRAAPVLRPVRRCGPVHRLWQPDRGRCRCTYPVEDKAMAAVRPLVWVMRPMVGAWGHAGSRCAPERMARASLSIFRIAALAASRPCRYPACRFATLGRPGKHSMPCGSKTAGLDLSVEKRRANTSSGPSPGSVAHHFSMPGALRTSCRASATVLPMGRAASVPWSGRSDLTSAWRPAGNAGGEGHATVPARRCDGRP